MAVEVHFPAVLPVVPVPVAVDLLDLRVDLLVAHRAPATDAMGLTMDLTLDLAPSSHAVPVDLARDESISSTS